MPDWSQLPADDPWACTRKVLRILRTSHQPWKGIESVDLDIAPQLLEFLRNEIYTVKDEAYFEACRRCIFVLGQHRQLGVVTDWYQLPTDPWDLIPEVLRVMRSYDEPWRGIELLRPDVIPNLTKFLQKEVNTTKDDTYRGVCARCLQVLDERNNIVAMDWSNLPSDKPWTLIRAALRILRVSDQPWNDIESVPSDEAQALMDFLQDELDTGVFKERYRMTYFKCLRVLGNHHHIMPSSFFLGNVKRDGEDRPVAGAGFADHIWKGVMEEKTVCLMVLPEITSETQQEILMELKGRKEGRKYTNFCREALIWRQLRHPNVLPFLGVNKDLFAPRLCMISLWMEHKDIVSFLKENPSHDRLQAIYDIAQGIQYLHESDPPIVHGDIKGTNVLVDNDQHCRVAGFGLSMVADSAEAFDEDSILQGSLRWMPPEALDYSRFKSSYVTAKDIYSFGCTILEIYTGKPPFSHLKNGAAVIAELLFHKNKPPRPSLEDLLSDELWALVSSCLSLSAEERPSATDVTRILHTIQVSRSTGVADSQQKHAISSLETSTAVLEYDLNRLLKPGSPWDYVKASSTAQEVMDTLQDKLDSLAVDNDYRSIGIRCLYVIGKAYSVLPASFFCADVQKNGTEPVGGGAFADVYEGKTSHYPMPVCLKYLRVTLTHNNMDLMKDLIHEALLWRQLRHPNVLSFLGVDVDLSTRRFCLVSPWMDNGNIIHFLRTHRDHDKFQSILDVAEGMRYLHELRPAVVHSDIRGANVLVTDQFRCVLADFGISSFVETRAPGTSTRGKGATRWMAPEMLDDRLFDHLQPFTTKDVYSFGCTVIEIYTGRAPFAHLENDARVITEVLMRNGTPPRPTKEELPSDELWRLVSTCFSRNPSYRPTAASLLQSLQMLQNGRQVATVADKENSGLAVEKNI